MRVDISPESDWLYGEIGKLKDAAQHPDLGIVLGYLGVSIQRTRDAMTFDYHGPEEMANRTDDLNKHLRRAGMSIVGVHPYDGPEMPGQDYLGHIAEDRLPITTGRAGAQRRTPWQALRRDGYPNVRVQIHDMLVHYGMHLAQAPEYRQEKCDFIAQSLERPDDIVPLNSDGSTLTRGARAMRAIEEGLQFPSPFDFRYHGDVWDIVAGSVLAIREWHTGKFRGVGGWTTAAQERAQIAQRNQEHIAGVAGVILERFPDTKSAVATA